MNNADTATAAALVAAFDLFAARVLGHKRRVPFGVVLCGRGPERVAVLSREKTRPDHCLVASASRILMAHVFTH